MAEVGGEVNAKLALDYAEFSKGMRDASEKTNALIGGLGNLGGGLGKLTQGFATFGLAAGGLKMAVEGIASVASGMVKGNAEFERYQTQFGVLLGSADAAKTRLGELADFGAKTPFELPEVVRADKVLTAFGLDSATTAAKFGVSATQIRTTIGDVASGTGGSFEELAGTFGKFASGATGDAIARFQEMGIATKEEMASWGMEFSKAGALLTPTAEAFTMLESHVRGKFGGMMDAQSSTFEGMVSNLQDWAGATQRQLAAPIFDVLKDKLGGVLTFFGSAEVKGALDGFATSIAGGIGSAVTTIESGVGKIGDVLGYLSAGNTKDVMREWFGDAGPQIDNVVRSIQGIVASIPGLVAQGQALAAAFGVELSTALTALTPTFELVKVALGTIGTAIASLVPSPLIELVQGISNAAKEGNLLGGAFGLVVSAVNALSTGIAAATGFISEHKGVQAALVGVVGALTAAWGLQQIAAAAHAIAVGISTVATQALSVAQGLLNTIMSANPIGLAVVALAGLAAGLVYAYENCEPFRTAVDQIWTTVKGFAEQALPVITAGIDGLVSAFNSVVTSIKSVIDWIGQIHMPEIALPDLSGIRLPGFANGVSNFSGGLAMVGERGPELMNLPGGTAIHSAAESKSMLPSVMPVNPTGVPASPTGSLLVVDVFTASLEVLKQISADIKAFGAQIVNQLAPGNKALGDQLTAGAALTTAAVVKAVAPPSATDTAKTGATAAITNGLALVASLPAEFKLLGDQMASTLDVGLRFLKTGMGTVGVAGSGNNAADQAKSGAISELMRGAFLSGGATVANGLPAELKDVGAQLASSFDVALRFLKTGAGTLSGPSVSSKAILLSKVAGVGGATSALSGKEEKEPFDYDKLASAVRRGLSGMRIEAEIDGKQTSVLFAARSLGLGVG